MDVAVVRDSYFGQAVEQCAQYAKVPRIDPIGQMRGAVDSCSVVRLLCNELVCRLRLRPNNFSLRRNPHGWVDPGQVALRQSPPTCLRRQLSFPLIKRRVRDNSIAGNNGGYLRESASGILGATLGNAATDSYANTVNFGRDKTAFAPISVNREDC